MPTEPAPIARTVAACSSAEVSHALNTCFERYFVQMNFSPERYETRFRAEHLDPYASRIWFEDARPVAIVLVARRGWTSRIAAMAVAVALRGRGFGKRMLEGAIEEARTRGDQSMVLEVIEQNAPARSLYAALGFEPVRRLVGYRRPAIREAKTVEGAHLVTCDPSVVARAAVREDCAELPWGLAPETLAAAALPSRAWSLEDDAWALVSDPAAPALTLSGLVVRREKRRRGLGTRLVEAIAAEHPGKELIVPGIVPDTLAPGFFRGLGFEAQPIAQLELRLDLTKRR